jgi:hypothetical protein
MACLLVPTTAAIVTTAVRKKIPNQYHINWLLLMLWGGVLMLLVDHVISGELLPYPPFLTAGIEKIIPEIFAVGVPMTLIVIAAWILMIIFSSKSVKRTAHAELE